MKLINVLVDATKEIAIRVNQGALVGMFGSTRNENIQGETQKSSPLLQAN